MAAARGFEAPPFNPGNVVSQDSWIAPSLTTTSAVVETGTGKGGGQSLRVNKGALNNGFWTRNPGTVSGVGITYTPNRYVTIDWDHFRTVRPVTTGDAPVFGVQSYSNLQGGFTQHSGVVVDATTGNVFVQTAASGGALVESGQSVAANTWNHFRIQLDFISDTYEAFLNGTRILTNAGFIDGPQTVYSHANIVALAAFGDFDSQNNTGFANIDNFIVRDGLPSDFNHNGAVDLADYSVWRDQQGQTGWGLAADANGDGVVNAADRAEWITDFGRTNGVVTTMSMADYNANGVVDAADYTLWRENNGRTGALLTGDGDGDGIVTNLDFEFWRDRFGQTGATAVVAASAVPEPVAGAMAVVALICATRCASWVAPTVGRD